MKSYDGWLSHDEQACYPACSSFFYQNSAAVKCLHDLIMLTLLLLKPTGWKKKNLNACKKKLEIWDAREYVMTAKNCVSTGRWACKNLIKQRNGG